MTPTRMSDHGLALTMQFEGLRLTPYRDSGGTWTVGYGHTGPGVGPDSAVNPAQATVLLRSDMAAAETCVVHAVKVPLNQHQFDALTDFAFNAGRHAFVTSSLLGAVNRGDFAKAAGLFGSWVDCNGRPVPGLVRRRAAEKALFLEAV